MDQDVVNSGIGPGDIQVPVVLELPAETAAAAAGSYPNGDLQIPGLNYSAGGATGSELSSGSSRGPLTAVITDGGQQLEVPAFVVRIVEQDARSAESAVEAVKAPVAGDSAAAPAAALATASASVPVVAEPGSVAIKPPSTDVVSKPTSSPQTSPTQPASAGATAPSPASGGVLRPRPKGAPRASAATLQATTQPRVEPPRAEPGAPKQVPSSQATSRPRRQSLGQAVRKVASRVGNAAKSLRQPKPAAQQPVAAKPALVATKKPPARQATPSRSPEQAKLAPKRSEEETGPKSRPQQSAPQKGGDLGQKVGSALAGAAQRLRPPKPVGDQKPGDKKPVGDQKPAGEAKPNPGAPPTGNKPAGDKGAAVGDAAKKAAEGAAAVGGGVLGLAKHLPAIMAGGIIAFLALGLATIFSQKAGIVVSRPQAVLTIVLLAALALIGLFRR